MLLTLPGLSETVRPLSGTAVPVIFYKGKVAQPNTSFRKDGKLMKLEWSCADWVVFHQGLVKKAIKGGFTSYKKYTNEEANKLANQVVTQHWAHNATFFSNLTLCGFGTAFYNYFVMVGMGDVVTNIIQRVAKTGTKFVESTAENVTKLATSVQGTLVNVVDKTGNVVASAVDTAGSFVGVVKYVVPVIIGGVVIFVGAYAYKNFIKGDSKISIPTPAGVVKV